MKLISPREAAMEMGVSITTVKTWINRPEHPLPAVKVGTSGRFHKVIAEQVRPWLVAEANRQAGASK